MFTTDADRARIAEQQADLAAGRLIRNADGTVSPTATYHDTPERAARMAQIVAARDAAARRYPLARAVSA